MKRCAMALAIILLILCGCSEQPPQTTPPVTTTPPTTQADPGIYQPQSELEQATDGAVRVYATTENSASLILRMWGEDLLLIEQGEHTQISRLRGENCVRVYENTIDRVMICGLWILENEIAFYDQFSHSVIYLDGMLKEIKRIELPEETALQPVLSKDLKTVYYGVGTQLHGLDTQTGISSLLRQTQNQILMPVKLIFDESLLLCQALDGDGKLLTQFISPESGETVESIEAALQLDAWQDRYFACYQESVCSEWLFGIRGEAERTLLLPEQTQQCAPLLNIHSAVTVAEGQDGVVLELYDLDKGTRAASVLLPGCRDAYSFTADESNGVIWFVGRDAQEQEMLCRWEYGRSSVEDTTVYTERRYTREDPDTEGLLACAQRAKEISQRYGITLLLDEQLPTPEGYTFVYEYQVPALENALDTLEGILAKFPEGFLSKLENGGLRIGLVRSVSGITEESVPDGGALQYWFHAEGCIALELGQEMEQRFYHVLCHVLENHVYANSVMLDDWDSLNPNGFAYDGNYADYTQRTDKKYLEGDHRVFVSEYAKTFAKEDRATIFACAMMADQQEVFASQSMQKKLEKLCRAIRDAYDWKKDERTFPWEQYLENSIAYQPKK